MRYTLFIMYYTDKLKRKKYLGPRENLKSLSLSSNDEEDGRELQRCNTVPSNFKVIPYQDKKNYIHRKWSTMIQTGIIRKNRKEYVVEIEEKCIINDIFYLALWLRKRTKWV